MSQLSILDDDTQIFEGKPLNRFFKMRKWSIFVSIILILFSQNWLDFTAIKTSLMLSDLPSRVFHQSIWFTAVYLLVQSIFLITQVATGYKDSLENRALLSIRDQIEKISEVIDNLNKNVSALKIDSENEIRKFKKTASLGSPRNSENSTRIEKEIDSLHAEIEKYEKDKNELLYGNNLKRKIIQYTELLLDMIRVLPTLFILGFAIFTQSPY